MVFGLMRESTHKEIVAQLEARIDYLETKSYGLQTLADAQRSKLDKLTEQVTNTPAPTVKTTTAAPVQTKTVRRPNKSKTEGKVFLANAYAKRAFLEQLIPNAKFEVVGSKISTIFNGKPTVVRVAVLSTFNRGGNYSRSSFTINGANAGEIGVLLNKDQSLHSVFVIKKEHLTKSNNFAMGVTRPEIAQFAHNTSLVLRNFK